MKDFVQAFGGLVGVGLIGIVVVAAMFFADWLMMKFRRGPEERNDDDAAR